LRKLSVLILMFTVGFTCQGQKGQFENDMRTMAAAGKLENKIYSNKHAGFEVHLPQTPCDAKLNTTMNADNGSAMLLVCNHVVQGRGGMYTFSVLTETWEHFPTLQNVEQYVRSMRHFGERDPNIKMVEGETKHRMSGMDFWQTILSNHVPEGTYFQGLSCTHLNAYILCFKAEAPTVELVRALLNVDGKLKFSDAMPLKKTSNTN
jgi:hypothetical protein